MSEEPRTEGRVCERCGGSRFIRDYSEARVICRNCGCVVEDGIKDRGPEWRSFNQEQKEERSRAGPPSTPTIHDKGLSTSIGKGDRDARGNLVPPGRRRLLGRLRKWDRRSQLAGRNRYIAHALSDISRICSHLTPSNSVRERASLLYKRAAEADLIRGRPAEAVVTAALYVACTESGIPASIGEIADIAGVEEKRAKKAHRLLVQELNLDAARVSPNKYVGGILGNLDVSSAVREVSHEILTGLDGGPLVSTRSSRVLAAGAVYLAALAFGDHLTEEEVADAAGLSRASVQRVIGILREKAAEGTLPGLTDGEEGGRDG